MTYMHDTLWLRLTSPWKITMLLIGKPSISMGHGLHGYATNNQRVLITPHSKNPMKSSICCMTIPLRIHSRTPVACMLTGAAWMKKKVSNGQSTGSVETNPLVLQGINMYQWDYYLLSPSKNLFYCRVSKIGHGFSFQG